jgi:hypothetical protein
MNAYDFSINYFAGLYLLWGRDPYDLYLYRYPFPFTYFWALLALPGLIIPDTMHYGMPLMLIVWGVVNVALLIHAFRKNFWQWVFYFPFLHELSAGQVEMLFWTAERHTDRGWRGAALGAFLTLKPQSALILLPWHLVDWLKHDRRTLARWAACTVLLWGLPLLWRPDWITRWLGDRGSDANFIYSASVANGVFTLLRPIGVPLEQPYSAELLVWLGILGVIAAALYIVGQFQPNKALAKALAMLGSPLGLYYTQLTLMGTAPWWLLIPANWIGFLLSLRLENFVPSMLTPLAVIGWHVYDARRKRKREALLASLTADAPAQN